MARHNTVSTFNKIQQIHSQLFFPFEKEVENFHKRALQDADKNGKTMNNLINSVTLVIKKALMLLEMDLSI